MFYARKRLTSLSLIMSGLASLAAAGDVQADNANSLVRTGANVSDRLTLNQSEGGGHAARIHVAENSSLLLSADWMRDTPSLLTPGLIVQAGEGHILTASISGQSNQIAVEQTGLNNTASILSNGRANMVSVAQAGGLNTASVSQTGLRNAVAIFQR